MSVTVGVCVAGGVRVVVRDSVASRDSDVVSDALELFDKEFDCDGDSLKLGVMVTGCDFESERVIDVLTLGVVVTGCDLDFDAVGDPLDVRDCVFSSVSVPRVFDGVFVTGGVLVWLSVIDCSFVNDGVGDTVTFCDFDSLSVYVSVGVGMRKLHTGLYVVRVHTSSCHLPEFTPLFVFSKNMQFWAAPPSGCFEPPELNQLQKYEPRHVAPFVEPVENLYCFGPVTHHQSPSTCGVLSLAPSQ